MTKSVADDPVRLLKDLIACPSVTPTEAGALDLLEITLKSIGFEVTRLVFEGDGSYPVDNLFATRGTGGRRLLFAGHTDVVPPGDLANWTADPFTPREADGKLYGRGAADMKSGVAAFVAAAAAMPADAGTIMLAITNDEEADAINGTDKLMKWAEQNQHHFDFAIVGEPSSAATLGDSIKIGRRGSLSGVITVAGIQGHVAYPDKANNPMPALARVVTALDTTIDTGTEHFPATNLEVTSIDVGNAISNVIPAAGTIRFNIRYNDLWTPDTLTDWVRCRIASIDPAGASISFELAGTPSRSFLSPLSDDVQTLSATIAAITGQPPALSTGGGTSDARFIAQYGPVVECGLVGPSMHKADEHIALSDLTGLTNIYRRFMLGFFGVVS
ncbi:succinyl-diaminopimelate desuccinylase [Devosia neptuniae]|uniref:Succinyl-diaminopimelate desuccinylase n=1 Tax=Devosia litorisediminis TaxID=2829817 RepID=A0A942ECX6_9HYPH|nr:succinyl-diaminopimelate desuccinylase [Devosia neptuniae]MBS3849942.1 succinyl-diaminopimelate desuccinylase [Devosia litorisediminis]MCZ4346942.1 succinyl-diaminopimelate desuccinylase [Devosia neptuniae]